VNELYTDEHAIMVQADLLEQMYSKIKLVVKIRIAMISSMHELTRHKEIVVKKRARSD